MKPKWTRAFRCIWTICYLCIGGDWILETIGFVRCMCTNKRFLASCLLHLFRLDIEPRSWIPNHKKDPGYSRVPKQCCSSRGDYNWLWMFYFLFLINLIYHFACISLTACWRSLTMFPSLAGWQPEDASDGTDGQQPQSDVVLHLHAMVTSWENALYYCENSKTS